MDLEKLYIFIDLAGTFAFAISGALAARQKGLDVFGILVIAFTVACGGGIIRDVCIGAIPPAGLSDWRYLFVAIIAAILTMNLHSLVRKIKRPILLFDALGLGLFAVTGARKALIYGHNFEVAILVGMITAVGGGILRDVLLNRVPVVFEKEIYASAALLGASVMVLGQYFEFLAEWAFLLGFLICFIVRILALRFHWKLPAFKEKRN